MKAKRTLSLLSAAALTAALAIPSASAARFTDTDDHPAQAAIELFADLKLLNGDGDGTFAPLRTISRAEMCAILDRVFTFKDIAENIFPDLDEDEWYAENMLRANAAGIVLGDEVGIRPNDTIRWDEALTMISRAFHLPQDLESELPVSAPDWARGYIATLWAEGWLGEELPDPSAPFTRGDAVAVLNAVVSDLGWESTGNLLYRKSLVPILEDVPVLSCDPSAFYREDGRLYYDDGITPVAYGVDVSYYQSDIDWQTVAADGIQFAMLRLGFRGYGKAGTLNLDKYFEANLVGAAQAGLDVGIYFFSQATSPEEALEEAQFLLEHLDNRELTYPVVFDWENIDNDVARTDQVDNDTLNACALAFCDAIAQAGYQPMVYFNTHQALVKYDLSQLTQYPFWYAYYTQESTPALYYDFRMWQYTSSGSVAGILGRADMDICFYPFGRSAGEDAEEDTGEVVEGDTGTDAGENPGEDLGENPGADVGENPGTDVGENPGEDVGENPGADVGETPGEDVGENPGADVGENPGEDVGENPGADVGENPGADVGENPGADVGENPGEGAGEDAAQQEP